MIELISSSAELFVYAHEHAHVSMFFIATFYIGYHMGRLWKRFTP